MNLDRQEPIRENSESEGKENRASRSSKIVSINDSAKEKSFIHSLIETLNKKNLPAMERIETFFTSLFTNREIIPLHTGEFKEWQIKLSTVVLEGQRYNNFTTTVAPMALSELLLVGYFGMYKRCEATNRENFFEIWLKSTRRILHSS